MGPGADDDLAVLRTLRRSLFTRMNQGDSGARRALQAVEEMIGEREGAADGGSEVDATTPDRGSGRGS